MRKGLYLFIFIVAMLNMAQVRVSDPVFMTTDIWHDIRAYRGAGESLTTAFNDAITAADSGDIIYCNQTFTLDAIIAINKPLTVYFENSVITSAINPSILISVSDVTLKGIGGTKSKIDATTASPNNNVIKVYHATNVLSNILIEGLYIDGTTKTFDGDDREEGIGIWVVGIDATPDSNIVVRDCYFTNNHIDIHFRGVTHGEISGNYFNFDYPSFMGVLTTGAHSTLITGNRFVNESYNVINAIEINHVNSPAYDSEYSVVSNNIITGFNTEAINVSNRDVIVSNNTIHTKGDGITIAVDSGVADSTRFGHCNVFGNIIYLTNADSNQVGIQLNDNFATNIGIDFNRISDNYITLQSHGYGIRLNGGGRANTVENNYIRCLGDGNVDDVYSYGIFIGDGTHDSRIVYNKIEGGDSLDWGIYTDNTVDSIFIGWNDISKTNGQGIQLGGGAKNSLVGNVLHDNVGGGLLVVSGCTYLEYQGNTFYSNGSTDQTIQSGVTFATTEYRFRNDRLKYAQEVWVTHDAATDTVEMGILPTNAVVTDVYVWVQEAFNSDGNDNLTVGYTGTTNAYATTVDVSGTGVKAVTLGATARTVDATSRTIYAYYDDAGSDATTGEVHIIVEWMRAKVNP